jgi:hypothetical protein
MTKYRGVLLVPTIIEFESEGSVEHVTEQAKRIARGMGCCGSLQDLERVYEPKVMEVCTVGPKP